ncbi:MAG: PAS domain S-box protein [Anaerolineae bacterium]
MVTKAMLQQENAELRQRVAHLERQLAVAQEETHAAPFRSVLEHVPVAYQSLDEQGRFVDVNSAYCELTGYSADELLGKSFGDLWTPAMRAAFAHAFDRLKRDNEVQVDLHLMHKTGTLLEVALVGSVQRNAQGQFIRTHCVLHDVTARKRAEEGLEQARHTLAQAQKIAHLGSFEYVAATQTTVWSEEEYRIYGLDPAEPSPAYEVMLQESIHPDDAARLNEVFTQAMQSRSVYELEHRIVRPDGSVRWVYDRALPYFDGQGELERYIGTTLDITDRKRAEAERARLAADRDRYAERLQLILDQMPIACIMNDPDFNVVYWNRAAETIFGFSATEMLGRQPYGTFIAEEARAYVEDLRQQMAVQNVPTVGYNQNRTKDGRLILCEWHNTPLRDEAGRLTGFLAMAQDVTERKQAEQKLRESEVLLRQVLESIPDSTFALDRDYRLLIDNQRHQQELVASGGRPFEVGEWMLSPDYPAEVLEFWRTAYDRALAGETFGLEGSWVDTNRQPHVHENRFSPLRDAAGAIIGALVVAHDITERKWQEILLADQKKVLEMVAKGKPLSHILAVIAIAIEAHSPDMRCSILLLDSDGVHLHQGAGPSMPQSYVEAIDGVRVAPVAGSCGTAAYRRQPVYVVDIASDPLWVNFRDAALGHGFRACWSTPIFAANGAVLGTFAMYYPEPHAPGAAELALIDMATSLASIAIERQQAEQKLRESEEKYRGLMETLDSVVATIDYDGKFLYMNEIAAQQLGGTPPTLIGKTVHELFPEPVASQQLAGVRRVIAEDQGHVSESLSFVQGQARWFRSSLQPIHDERGRVAYALMHATDIHELKSTQQELQSRSRDMTLLLEAGRALIETLDVGQIYALLYRYLSQAMPCDMLIASSYDPQTELLNCEFLQTPEGPQDISEFPPIPLEPPGQGTQSRVIRTGESLLLPDYDQAFKTANSRNVFDEHGRFVEIIPDDPERTRSAILVPLRAEGAVVGVLQILSTELHAHTPDHLRFVEALAFRVSAAISNARLFAELEQRVQARTAEVQDLYDNAPAGYHSLDANGCFVQINQTELDWLGYARKEVIGRPFANFVTAQGLAIFNQNYPAFKQRGWLRDLEMEFVRRDGTTFYALVNATAIKDKTGNYLVSRSTVFDITERKRAEEALQASEAKYRQLFENMTEGFALNEIITDGNGRVVDYRVLDANEAYGQQTGLRTNNVIGKTIREIAPQADRPLIETLGKVALTGEPLAYEFFSKVFNRHFSVRAFSPKHGQFATIFEDITERKQSEDALRQVNVELARASRAKDEFLANMSHELRTPLNSVLGLAQSLSEQYIGPLNARQLEAVTIVETSGRHLLALINDILDLSKIEAGNVTLELARVDVQAVCQASLLFIKQIAHQKNIQVSSQFDEAVTWLQADERRLKQMLVNLLNNAVKFTPDGGVVELSVTGDRAQHRVQFSVRDTGIGIAADDVPRLFQPFMQLDSGLTRQYEGTGLGLSIVRRLAELHGGSVTVTSEPGRGSVFIISLPWTESPSVPDSATTAAAVTSTVVAAPRAAESAPLILMAEDNEANIITLRMQLETRGFQLAVAHHGGEVLEKVQTEPPALILMDLQMPVMDGWETTQRLRAHSDPRLASIPIIALTALAMPADRERALAAGVNAYLTKPIVFSQLVELIWHLLKEH